MYLDRSMHDISVEEELQRAARSLPHSRLPSNDLTARQTKTNFKLLSSFTAVLALGAVAVGTLSFSRAENQELRSAINNHVMRFGDGDIRCDFNNHQVIIHRKKISDVNSSSRPLIRDGLINGKCTATLS